MQVNLYTQNSRPNFGMAIKMSNDAQELVLSKVKTLKNWTRLNQTIDSQALNPVDIFFKTTQSGNKTKLLGYINNEPYPMDMFESIPHYIKSLAKIADKKNSLHELVKDLKISDMRRQFIKNTSA